MHIPDGFLSPQTCIACYATAAPVCYGAWKKIEKRFEATTAAHVGLAAAFVFLLQMINVPIPGGTSGHAVGAAIVTIALGPAAGIIATALALALQAVVFGDGGLLAYGSNVIVMAIVPSLVAWPIWRLRGVSAGKKATGATAFAAGYLSALAGGVTTGLLLGLQPLLFKSDTGAPNYFPLGLSVSVPAMFISHLLVGIVEGAITMGAVLALANMPEFQLQQSRSSASGLKKIAITVACMVVLVPIGVVLPGLLNAGEPWGEWSPEETAHVAGQSEVPAGLAKYADGYSAPVPDYQFAEAESLTDESAQYIGAALIGVLLVILISLPLHKLQQNRLRKIQQLK